MLYEKLDPEMQKMVDEYAVRLHAMDWGRRSDLLADAALSFSEDLDPEKAQLAAKGFVTAVLERWDLREVEHPSQACLYLVSLNREHRAMAKRYLELNPEIRAAVGDELAEQN